MWRPYHRRGGCPCRPGQDWQTWKTCQLISFTCSFLSLDPVKADPCGHADIHHALPSFVFCFFLSSYLFIFYIFWVNLWQMGARPGSWTWTQEGRQKQQKINITIPLSVYLGTVGCVCVQGFKALLRSCLLFFTFMNFAAADPHKLVIHHQTFNTHTHIHVGPSIVVRTLTCIMLSLTPPT